MREKILRRRNAKSLLSIVLALVIVFTMIPMTGMSVYAESVTW